MALRAPPSGARPHLLEGLTLRRVSWVTAICAAACGIVSPIYLNTYWDLLVTALCVGYTSMHGKRERLQWIKATVGQNLKLIPVAEVLFFQSDEKYTRVVLADGEALIKTPIRELMDGLDPKVFWQIHRSTVVNASAIASVSRDFRGQAHVKIKGKDESLVVSRIYSHLFKQM